MRTTSHRLTEKQIDVAVNAPEAGTIKEFLAEEEDTVVVGQDLLRMESGGEPAPKEEASSEAKEPASKEQSTSSDPKAEKKEEPAPPKEEKSAPAPPKEEKKAPAPAPKKSEPKSTQSEGASTASAGNREERRVCCTSTVTEPR